MQELPAREVSAASGESGDASPALSLGSRRQKAVRRIWQDAANMARSSSALLSEAAKDPLSELNQAAEYPDFVLARMPYPEEGLVAYAAPYMRVVAGELAVMLDQAERAGVVGVKPAGVAVLQAFRERLSHAVNKTSALLMNASRIRGELKGDTAEARAEYFSRRLLQPDYRKDCRERFPILDEVLLAMTRDAIASWREFFDRLTRDWNELGALSENGLGQVQSLRFYAGDPHNGGRSVVLLHTQSGSIVYKPRSLDTDAVLTRAIAWLDEQLEIGIHHFPVLQRDGYGWTTFVHQRDCADMEEVRMCFERAGALLGLLFLLGGGDIHHENIICDRSHPFIVDAESLLNGPLCARDAFHRRKQRARMETVLNTCYLPCLLPVGDGQMDISGAGYREGQEVTFKNRIPNVVRDDIEAAPETHVSPRSANLPRLGGVTQPAVEHVDSIEKGFRAALGAMLEKREEFITRADLLPSFGSATFRFIPRATLQYSQTLQNSMHPHACVSREANDRAIASLAWHMSWPAPIARAILAADIEAIRRGDVPFYKGSADSLSIWTTSGDEIPRVFQQTGHDSVAQRLRKLDAHEIEAQVSTLRLTFSASLGRVISPPRPKVEDKRPFGPDLPLRTAKAIGDLLIERAIDVGDQIHWVGRTTVGESFSVALTEPELYGGVAGIGLFFGELANVTGDRKYRGVARKCRATCRSGAPLLEGRIGAFDGLSGIVYADLAISHALGSAPSAKLEGLLRQMQPLAERDTHYDIISGAAGALLVALRARATPELTESANELARVCARRILDGAESHGSAVAWKLQAFDMPLTGLGHGACGIALALAEYAATFDDGEAWRTCRQALDYARDSFDPAAGTWRDLRFEHGHMMAWCHGAPGIALARQRILELDPPFATDGIRRDVALALDAIERLPTPAADTICHGRSGNWETLWRGEARHRNLAASELADLCNRWQDGQVPAGDLGEATPDLMNGLAGVGLQLIRSLSPNRPCVALLDL